LRSVLRQAPELERHFGVGVDVVGVDRMAQLAEDHLERLDDVFTPAELAYCAGKRRRDEHLAARFAAKEAVLKAIGTGLRRRMHWTDVEVVRERGGRPAIRLSGEVAQAARERGIARIEVSLSHTSAIALAGAVAVFGGGTAACAST
jgi:holo-[acyl-carrier protein] synthase